MAGDKSLPRSVATHLNRSVAGGVAVSAISCWEVAKLVERGRLTLSRDVLDWLKVASSKPISVIEITPEIAVEATRLPGHFHNDPADQLIVATSRLHGTELVTLDRKILEYKGVKCFVP
jgi:PIN domain nuclease of toxin-antitoxin system